jgi:oligopeptidase A
MARGLQRDAARHHALLRRGRAEPGAVRQIQGAARQPEFATLSPARQRILDNELRDFRLSGAELPDEQKPRFQAIQEEQAGSSPPSSPRTCSTPPTPSPSGHRRSRAGRPARGRAPGRPRSRREGRQAKAGSSRLQMPSYLPVLQYADSRELRARMYRAYATRASELGNGYSKLDNGPLIGRILALRAEEARMLGYRNFAEVSLVPKMADTPAEQVLGFLRDLGRQGQALRRARPGRTAAFAKASSGLDTLEPWDVAYASEKLRDPALRLLRAGGEAVLPRAQGARRPVRRDRKLYGVDILPDRRRSGTPTCASSASSADGERRTRRPVLPRPARARAPSAAAPGWTKRTRRRNTCGMRRRWPTWCATSPARSAANPPPSPTTT